MRTARKIMLIVGMALAAMAITATTASAAESEVEVINEDTLADCAPCEIHLVGESHITALPAGVIVSSCRDEFEGIINHDGTGEVTWDGGEIHDEATCALVNCQTGDEPHWPIDRAGELGTGEEHIWARFCLRNPGTGAELHCDAEVHVDGEVDDPAQDAAHHYFFETETLCAFDTRRVEGHWEIEDALIHDEIEFVHHS